MDENKVLPSPVTEQAKAITTDDDSAQEIEVLLAKHKIPRATVEKLKESHRRLYVLYDAPIIFKAATGDQLDRALGKPEKEKSKALREMVSFLVLHPSKEQYAEMLVDAPLLWDTVCNAVHDIAKNRTVTEAVKL